MIRKGIMLVLMAGLSLASVSCRNGETGGGGKVAVPVALPADLPLPAAAALRTAQDLGEKGLNLVFEARGEPVAAAAAYRERLSGAGWRLVAEAEEGTFMSFRKESRSVAVGVSGTEGVTSISLAYVAPL